MAIIRSGARVSKANNHSSSSTDEDPPVKPSSRSVGRGFSFDDSDFSGDSEPIDAGSEMCQVGDDMCALPLELFEAGDLKKILSLDTWNYCLTEEERESLFGLLPNMDEDLYRRTLTELLAGEDFNFGSPLTDLFERLKGGLCNPHVVRYSDGLKYLQRNEHYHQVRKYHNRMVNYFLEMQNTWRSHAEANMEERLEMWNSWKFKKLKPTLNGFPGEKTEPFRNQRVQGLVNRRAKFLKSKEMSKASLHVSEEATAPAVPEMDFKGFRTVKGDRAFKKDVDLSLKFSLENPSGKPKKQGPKGVLKTVPKGCSKKHVKLEVGGSQALPSFDFKGTDLRHLSTASVEDESTMVGKGASSPGMYEPALSSSVEKSPASPVMEKPVTKRMPAKKMKLAPEMKEKSSGIGRKRKRVKETDENDFRMGKAEFSVGGEISPDEVLDNKMKVPSEPQMGAEQMQKDSSFLDENKSDERKKKSRKRSKAKEKGLAEEDQVFSVVKTELNGDAYIGEKELEDPAIEYKELSTEVTDVKPLKRGRKRLRAEDNGSLPQSFSPDGEPVVEKPPPSKSSRKPPPPTVPPVALGFPFSVIHLVSAVRTALTAFHSDQASEAGPLHGEGVPVENSSNGGRFLMSPEASYLQANGQSLQGDDALDVIKEQEEKKFGLPATPLQEIVKRVQANPGDQRILETQEPLQGLVRGVLKVLSSKTTQPGIKGWKPFVVYDKEARGWSWIGPLPPLPVDHDSNGVQISVEAWGVPQKTLYKIQELFGNWLKHEQETLQQLGQLSLPTPPSMPTILDEKERFRELRAQKSLITIIPTSDEMRDYFRREEALRYSIPDRAFSYTSSDGRKSVVAPLRRIGGKPNSKARDHFMLKPDRPPHVTILCLVRDAAARLPGSIGTRADVCALIRDSQFIVEDVSDAQLNQVVSGALDRLHYERDPCVRFDGDRKLWVYLHTDKDEEDFEDDATSSTKRWKRSKKEGIENPDFSLAQDYDYQGRDDQDACGLGLDFSPSSCFGGPGDLSSVYSSAGRPELMYGHQNGSLASPGVLGTGFPGQVREDGMLPFIELPPSIQPPCVNMQQSHPMGWEVLGNRWDQDDHFQSHDHIVQDDFGTVAPTAISHRESGVMIERGIP